MNNLELATDPALPPTTPPPGILHASHAPRRWWLAVASVAIVAAIACAYSNSFWGSFVFDDENSIVSNFNIRQWDTAWANSLSGMRPVVDLSLAMNYQVSQLAPWSYHVVNLLVHITAALLLLALIRRTLLSPRLAPTFGPHAIWPAMLAAMLWGLHPLQTQAVTYVVQRGESMMAMFYLLTIYLGLRGMESQPHRKAWWSAAIAACALGMGTKQVMVTAPLAMLLYDRVFVSESWKSVFRRHWPLYAGLAATWAVLVLIMHSTSSGASAGAGLKLFSWQQYSLTQFGVIMHYLRLAVWPAGLCLDYNWPIAQSTLDILLPGAAIVLLLILTALALWKKPAIGFAALMFFLILAPTSTIMPIADVAVEHRMYLPLAPLAALAAAGVYWLSRRLARGRAVVAAAVLCLLLAAAGALGYLTFQRNADYYSAAEMWRDVAVKRPRNARAFTLMGYYLVRQGKSDQAEQAYLKALEIRPGYAEPLNNLGLIYAGRGEHERAIECFEQSIKDWNTYAEAHLNLAHSLQALGRADDALKQLALAAGGSHTPAHAQAEHEFGLALMARKEFRQAVGHLREAVRLRGDVGLYHYSLGKCLEQQEDAENAGPGARRDLSPAVSCYVRAVALDAGSYEPHYALAKALARQGRKDQALEQGRAALAIRPTSAEANFLVGDMLEQQGGDLKEVVQYYLRTLDNQTDHVDAHTNLAIILAQTGHIPEAKEHFLKAVALAPNSAQANLNLGQFYQMAQDIEPARACYQKALGLAPAGDATMLRTIQGLLAKLPPAASQPTTTSQPATASQAATEPVK